jgi:hypothetical protein
MACSSCPWKIFVKDGSILIVIAVAERRYLGKVRRSYDGSAESAPHLIIDEIYCEWQEIVLGSA